MNRYLRKHQTHEVNGVRGTIMELASYFRVVTPRLAMMRVSEKGWDVARAVTEPRHESMSRAKK